ncbi:unnamed protein product, partial [Adineta steineri]
QQQDGMQKRFVQFLFENHNLEPSSGEPIYRNGEFCEFVSAAYVCLGFVHAPSSEKITVNYNRGATYEIDIATKQFKALTNVYQPTEMGPTVPLYTN